MSTLIWIFSFLLALACTTTVVGLPSYLSADELAWYRCEWNQSGTSPERQIPKHVHKIDRLRNEEITKDTVIGYINRQQPVIVSGLVPTWQAYKKWDVYYFVKEFGEYGSLHDWSAETDTPRLTAENYKEVQQENPKVYVVWTAYSDSEEELNKKVSGDISYPAFLPTQFGGSRIVDWMYSGYAGTGAGGHRDTVCDGTWVAQLKGRKQWCFSTYPDKDGAVHHYAGTQEKGDMLLFSVPMWHSTHLAEDSMSLHGYFPLRETQFNITQFICDAAGNDVELFNEYCPCFGDIMWNCRGYSKIYRTYFYIKQNFIQYLLLVFFLYCLL